MELKEEPEIIESPNYRTIFVDGYAYTYSEQVLRVVACTARPHSAKGMKAKVKMQAEVELVIPKDSAESLAAVIDRFLKSVKK